MFTLLAIRFEFKPWTGSRTGHDTDIHRLSSSSRRGWGICRPGLDWGCDWPRPWLKLICNDIVNERTEEGVRVCVDAHLLFVSIIHFHFTSSWTLFPGSELLESLKWPSRAVFEFIIAVVVCCPCVLYYFSRTVLLQQFFYDFKLRFFAFSWITWLLPPISWAARRQRSIRVFARICRGGNGSLNNGDEITLFEHVSFVFHMQHFLISSFFPQKLTLLHWKQIIWLNTLWLSESDRMHLLNYCFWFPVSVS